MELENEVRTPKNLMGLENEVGTGTPRQLRFISNNFRGSYVLCSFLGLYMQEYLGMAKEGYILYAFRTSFARTAPYMIGLIQLQVQIIVSILTIYLSAHISPHTRPYLFSGIHQKSQKIWYGFLFFFVKSVKMEKFEDRRYKTYGFLAVCVNLFTISSV